MRILLVDDNEDSLQSLNVVLSDLGHDPVPISNAEEALIQAQDDFFPLVITDIRMPGMDGLELLSRLRNSNHTRHSDVVIITGHGDMETAVEALRKGAYDYLNKPINARELAAVVERCAEHQALLMENQDWRSNFHTRVQEATEELRQTLDEARGKLRVASGATDLVAESPAMRRLIEEIRLYHDDPSVPVLIEGETGVGKETLARRIHDGDGTSGEPFVALNCAAIPTHLFESELLGHEAGSFSGGARRGTAGKLELAENGALFLDDISEMPLHLQPKLLRILEDKTFYRVEGTKKREFKARVICAASRDLLQLVESGDFRRDLYHRIKVGHLLVPPLRERPEDIAPLAKTFLLREALRKKKSFRDISPAALDTLKQHPWPGNIRELENVIERIVLTRDAEILLPEHIDFPRPGSAQAVPVPRPTAPAFAPDTFTLPEQGFDLEEFVHSLLVATLDKFHGNKTKAAKYLGMSRYALHRRLQKE